MAQRRSRQMERGFMSHCREAPWPLMPWSSRLSGLMGSPIGVRERRVLVLYLVIIGIPTIALISFGFTAFEKQRVALRDLTRANLLLAGETLSADFEHQALSE